MPHRSTRHLLRRVAGAVLTMAAVAAVAGAAGFGAAVARQAAPPDPAEVVAAQQAAMAKLAFMDGHWRGTAVTRMPGGEVRLTQTERVGPMLGGAIRVVEGRGYDAAGTTAFNAFAVLSYDPAAGAYSMRSYAEGRTGDFPLEVRPDGFTWRIALEGFEIRYTATIADGRWREVGERIVPGRPPMQFFEMDLERLDDTEWPAMTPVPWR